MCCLVNVEHLNRIEPSLWVAGVACERRPGEGRVRIWREGEKKNKNTIDVMVQTKQNVSSRLNHYAP